MTKLERAEVIFNEGFNCCQSVIAVFAEKQGLKTETALKLASGFGGGMGKSGETCGAVTGAYMVLGLKYGGKKAEDTEAKKRTYALVREFSTKFRSVNGSLLCRDLLGCDIGTEEGRRRAREKNLFSTLCPKIVMDSVGILEQLL